MNSDSTRRPSGLPEVVPGQVLELTPLDGTGSRFRVSMAAGAKFVASGTIVLEFRLRDGSSLDDDQARRLTARVRRLALFDRAVRSLAARGLSARDLGVRLRRAGGTQEEAAAVIEELSSLGILDDASYARTLAGRRAASGMPRARINQELRRRGVAGDVASSIADEVSEESGVDEYDGARAAAEKRLRSLVKLDIAVARRRLHGYLARRGYGATVIRRVLADVFPR
jgi:regulatory protein